jgi:hypothetical protein
MKRTTEGRLAAWRSVGRAQRAAPEPVRCVASDASRAAPCASKASYPDEPGRDLSRVDWSDLSAIFRPGVAPNRGLRVRH